jgi:hypothetical protein
MNWHNGRIAAALLALVALTSPSFALEEPGGLERTLHGIAAVAPAIVLPQRTEVLATAVSTIVNHKDVKGEFGEALARSQRLLNLGEDKSYVSVAPRAGRQGIDVLMLGVDGRGRANGEVLVVESKFAKRTPKLSVPKDGFQGSRAWVDRRLTRVAGDLGEIGASERTWVKSSGRMPSGGIPVRLADGTRGWVHFDGERVQTDLAEGDFKAARNQAAVHARTIRDALRTKEIQSKVMWVAPRQGGYEVTVADIPRHLNPRQAPRIDSLPNRQTSFLRVDDFKVAKASIAAISKDLKARSPHLGTSECNQLARAVFDQGKAFHESVEMSRAQQWMATGRMVAFAGSVPIVLVIGQGLVQTVFGDGADWGQLAKAGAVGGGAAVLGTGTGIVVTALAVEQPAFGRALATVGRAVGLKPVLAYRVAGGFTGGAVASIALAGILLLSGDIDGQQALVLGGVGVASAAVVAAAEVAAFSAISAFAAASTGTAISSLSGAAASSASMAWLGGGSLAAGGLGVTGGLVVLTAGGAVIAIAAGWAIISAYEAWDTSRELNDLTRRLDYFRSDWGKVLNESPLWHQAMVHPAP